MILSDKMLVAIGEYYVRRAGENRKTTLNALKLLSGVNVSNAWTRNVPSFEKDKLLEKIREACNNEIGYVVSAGHFFFRNGEEREEMDENSWPNFIPKERRFLQNENQN